MRLEKHGRAIHQARLEEFVGFLRNFSFTLEVMASHNYKKEKRDGNDQV